MQALLATRDQYAFVIAAPRRPYAQRITSRFSFESKRAIKVFCPFEIGYGQSEAIETKDFGVIHSSHLKVVAVAGGHANNGFIHSFCTAWFSTARGHRQNRRHVIVGTD